MAATVHPEVQSLEILGVRVHRLSMHEALTRLESLLDENKFHQVVTLGVEMIMHAQQDAEYRELVNQADLVVPDSAGVVWASRRCAYPLAERVPGVDLIPRLATLPSGRKPRLFLLGASPGVAEAAAAALEQRFGVEVAGTMHGYFKDDQEAIAAVNASRADILLAALGFPRQEKWMQRHAAELGVRVGIGVGGSLDVYAGKVQRAPGWMCSLGLEWFYRLVRQPSRFTRMLAIPRFMLQVVRKGAEGARAL
ncbi:WecB/TagA/CpsF family glycosyltransferase [bacterium CPR1]|nr:WecB/TagA/CpsF family glycosyltransferase [bacterium CPR1]